MTTIGDYILNDVIGQGTFASVRIAEHQITHTQVAVKIIPRHNFADPDHVDRFKREVDLIKDLDHPFIAEFFEVLEDEENFYIIMEYVQNGNMLNYVNNNGELSEEQARHYFCQIVSVLEYLHTNKKIAHRDLKAENVLLDRHDNIRLIDFGLSNTFSKENQFLKTACGSPAYASPEMIKGEPYTISSDYWSAGILLYAMVVGELPFEDDNIQRLLQKIIKTQPKYPSTLSFQLRDLLNRLLEKDPNKRISLKKIKEHPWFSQYEYMLIKDSSSWRINPNNTNDAEEEGGLLSSRNRATAGSMDPVDREIVQKMTDLGFDCSSIVSAILCGEISPLTAVYRMLRKEKIIDLIGLASEAIYGKETGAAKKSGFSPKTRDEKSKVGSRDRRKTLGLSVHEPSSKSPRTKYPPRIPLTGVAQGEVGARSPRASMHRRNVSLSARASLGLENDDGKSGNKPDISIEITPEMAQMIPGEVEKEPTAEIQGENEVAIDIDKGFENHSDFETTLDSCSTPTRGNSSILRYQLNTTLGATPLLQSANMSKKSVTKPNVGATPLIQRKKKSSVRNNSIPRAKSLNIY